MALSNLRGMNDWGPDDCESHQHVIDTATRIATLYGYRQVQIPVLEPRDLFTRPLGEDSDVASKEMYAFADRNGTNVCLRPELTAGIVRSALKAKNALATPLRWLQTGPAFRYERPQQGRYRQFTQVSLEHLGSAEPFADIECLVIAWRLIESLGLASQVRLDINSLGSPATRIRYRDALRSYLLPFRDQLAAESQIRLDRNPLRILDSKNPDDKAICRDAPHFDDYWDESDRKFFTQITDSLTSQGIPWEYQPLLVRGLDYYCHTVFEFCSLKLGAQDAVLSGGRYDGLATMLQDEHKKTSPSSASVLPGVGWAMGVERIAQLIAPQKTNQISVAILPFLEDHQAKAHKLAEDLRAHNVCCLMCAPLAQGEDAVSRKRLGRVLVNAEKLGAKWGILIGTEESEQKIWTLRDFANQKNHVCKDIDVLLKIMRSS